MKKVILFLGIIILSLNTYSQLKVFKDTTYHFSFEYPGTYIKKLPVLP